MQNHLAPGPTPIPPAGTSFVLPDARRFELDLVEAYQEIAKIGEAHKEPNYGEHLVPWLDWIRQRTGMTLTKSQADWLWDHVIYERARARQVFQDSLKSLSSTASTPSDSLPNSTPDFTPISPG